MTEYCADMESPLQSLPQCVICLTEIADLTLKQERSEWNLDEACVLKLFEIDPESLDNFPSLTYFCQTCSLRNHKMWELCSQISLLQQSLQEMKLTLETDFKRCFSSESSDPILDRTNFLRYQLAKSIKILPREANYEDQNENARTSLKFSLDTSDLSIASKKVTRVPNSCPEDMSGVAGTDYVSRIGSNSLSNPDEASQVTLEEQFNTERLLTELEPKVGERARRRKVLKKSFEKAMPEAVKKEDVKLKDLRVKICIIPSDLLSNVPINVHTIPGYVPPPTVRLSSQGTMSKIKQILEAESESDVEIISDRDWDCEEGYCVSEYTETTTMNQMGNSRKRSAGIKRLSVAKTESHQETRTLKKNISLKLKGNRDIVKRSKNGFYCNVPECASIRSFSSKLRLEIHHKKVHEGITHPFKCEDCGKSYQMLTQLNFHHKTIHLGQFDLFNCEFCGRGFKLRGNLEQHRVIHTGERRFKCPECPMDFKTPHGKKLHIRYAHTGERPYTCDVCGKGFVSSTKLNNHLKCIHHREDRPIICHICGKNFPIQGYLYMHMKTHEKEAAAAAGLPVKRKPRWKKKPEPPVEEEPVSFEGGTTTAKRQDEGTHMLKNWSHEIENIILPGAAVCPQEINYVGHPTVPTVIQSGEVLISKAPPLDPHLHIRYM